LRFAADVFFVSGNLQRHMSELPRPIAEKLSNVIGSV